MAKHNLQREIDEIAEHELSKQTKFVNEVEELRILFSKFFEQTQIVEEQSNQI